MFNFEIFYCFIVRSKQRINKPLFCTDYNHTKTAKKAYVDRSRVEERFFCLPIFLLLRAPMAQNWFLPFRERTTVYLFQQFELGHSISRPITRFDLGNFEVYHSISIFKSFHNFSLCTYYDCVIISSIQAPQFIPGISKFRLTLHHG